MLPPFIIEQIRQREEEQRREQRPVLELPLDGFRPRAPSERVSEQDPAPERGVAIIEL
jgi:hypothetical protein